jgi:hypothetical protein
LCSETGGVYREKECLNCTDNTNIKTNTHASGPRPEDILKISSITPMGEGFDGNEWEAGIHESLTNDIRSSFVNEPTLSHMYPEISNNNLGIITIFPTPVSQDIIDATFYQQTSSSDVSSLNSTEESMSSGGPVCSVLAEEWFPPPDGHDENGKAMGFESVEDSTPSDGQMVSVLEEEWFPETLSRTEPPTLVRK